MWAPSERERDKGVMTTYPTILFKQFVGKMAREFWKQRKLSEQFRPKLVIALIWRPLRPVSSSSWAAILI